MGMEGYKLEAHPMSRKEAIIQGDCYRITMLTSALVRLEYNEGGVFEDRATQSILNRDFPVPESVSYTHLTWMSRYSRTTASIRATMWLLICLKTQLLIRQNILPKIRQNLKNIWQMCIRDSVLASRRAHGRKKLTVSDEHHGK